MSTLLLELEGNWEFNHTIFPPRILVYDDLLIYRKRRFLKLNEVTISYSHIVRVNLIRGIIFASLEIVTSADENVIVKYIPKDKAIRAKKIIDQKIYGALAKHKTDISSQHGSENREAVEFEKSLHRINELRAKDRITQKEYKHKKAELLKNIK